MSEDSVLDPLSTKRFNERLSIKDAIGKLLDNPGLKSVKIHAGVL